MAGLSHRLLWVNAILMFLLIPGTGLALDATEQEIIDSIDGSSTEAQELLREVVGINSGTQNFSGVQSVGRVFQQRLEKLGFSTRWDDGSEFRRAGHLWAGHGNSGTRFLLIGHLDTVFASDSPFQGVEELPGNRWRGPGITDMKGGDVIIVYLLEALKAAGVLEHISVQVVMTGDEESRGKPHSLANKTLLDAARWADVALGFEDGDGDPETAVISRRGSVGWKLSVTGKPAHSSQIFRPDVGYGAVFEAARILNEFRVALADQPLLTFNPGVIVGGTDVTLDATASRGSAFGKSNVIARSVEVKGGIRAVSPQQLANAQQLMQEITRNNLAQTRAVLSFSDGYPPMAATDGNRELLAMYTQASQDLGFGAVSAVDPRRAGAADISFAAGHVMMALDGLGLMGYGGHTEGETALMNTLTQQMKRAALVMYRLLDCQACEAAGNAP
ncbi:MAG: M20/M25/M40 family metallo-hydrolase [Lysobacterales bacterium]